jgi:hypothetical protein
MDAILQLPLSELHVHPITLPPDLNRQTILAKRDFFVDNQLWPAQPRMDPEGWLGNFRDEELPFALRLLDSFIYYSEALCDQLLYASFQSLSRSTRSVDSSFAASISSWRAFVDRVIITYVTGERPNVTDSGFLFARKARQLLGIDQDRILSPDRALQELVRNGPRPVVFVDDFVGSGNQFTGTWARRYVIPGGSPISFREYAAVQPWARFAYCPLICTEYGMDRIQRDCHGVNLNPAHVLPASYSAVSDESVVWPPHMKADGIEMVRCASARAGIPDTAGADEQDWQGFHCLGLTLAFFHSVPDATLPLFYWEENGWTPLLRRT